MRPSPAQLPALVAGLKAAGVRRLLVLLPHAPATLPQALRQGLTGLDEHAVAQLGFDHLLFMRSAQPARRPAAAHPLQRVADWALSQLQLIVPAHEQPVQPVRPVRPVRVARLPPNWRRSGRLTRPARCPGPRIVPSDVVWEAAQQPDMASLARFACAWLAGPATPPAPVPVARL